MASDVLANLALVVSRQLTSQVTLYSGPNLTIPIGHRDRGFFTPTKMQVNGIVGGYISFGKSGIYIEGNFGHMMALGIGMAYTF